MSLKNKCIETELIQVRIHIEIHNFTVGNKDIVQNTIQVIF